MNTAPKQQLRERLISANEHLIGAAEHHAAIAEAIAALAPPSGEGVDSPLVQRLGMLVTMLRAEAAAGNRPGYNFGEAAANRRSGLIADEIEQAIHEVRVLGKSQPQTAGEAELCRTTTTQPSPAYVDPTNKALRMLRCGLYDDAGKALEAALTTPQSAPENDAVETIKRIAAQLAVDDCEGDAADLTEALFALTTPPPASQESGGAALIAAERERQITVEGWTPEHDDEHDGDELAKAAACYATPFADRSLDYFKDSAPASWPWESKWWKPVPNDRVRELVKAGALIAAEIDRLQRASPPSSAAHPHG